MIRAFLHLEWFDEEGDISETKRTSSIEMACLPRIGERMRIDDDTWTTVTDILHVVESEGVDTADTVSEPYERPYILVVMRVQPPVPPLWTSEELGLSKT